ncbi:MAG: hypothetical protein P4L84_35910 [Isosphaeraceae bacterium]|nr:hypothetical protein [Isosphaeraceae bacterium]
MADHPPARQLLVVVGSTLRAEELDRPLGYFLRQRIEQAWDAGGDRGPLRVLVVADFRWLHEDELHSQPTVSVGGPGVNALAQQWLEEVPLSLAVEDQYYIQMDPDLEEPRASIWGMDNATTQIAVAVFIERFLPRFLEHCATLAPQSTDPDETD